MSCEIRRIPEIEEKLVKSGILLRERMAHTEFTEENACLT